jgi:hypothetical protein
VRVALGLWLVAVATGVAGESIGLCLARRITQQAIHVLDPGDADIAMVSPALTGTSPAGALFDLVLFTVVVAVLFAFRDGAHWSRATLTALGALTVLDRVATTGLSVGIYLAVGPGGRLDVALALVNVAAVVAATPLMYTRTAGRHLRRR